MANQVAISDVSLDINSDMRAYRRLLSEKMHRAVWQKGKWSPFLGNVIPNQKEYDDAPVYGGNPQMSATGNVIELLQDFKHKGGIEMDIPVKYPLTALATYGEKTLKGNEEIYKMGYKKTIINQVRHAVKFQDNKMSKQIVQSPEMQKQLFSKASADLTDYFSRWINFQPYYALFENYSQNITATTPNGGMAKSVIHHPNLYVANVGKIAGVPYTTAGAVNTAYATAMATALNGLTGATGEKMSVAVLENAIYFASLCKIPKVKTPKGERYIIFIDASQAMQLRKDTNFKSEWAEAGDRGVANPVLSGLIEIDYLGCLIIVDHTKPAVNVVDADTITYGESNPLATPASTSPYKPLVLVGASAITAGYADKLSFENEDDDYKQVQATGADMICGFQRSDLMDDDGRFTANAGAFIENNSSLIVITNSPSDGNVAW